MAVPDDELKATIQEQVAAVNGLAGRVDELSTSVRTLRDTVFGNYEQFQAFANVSREDRHQLNERLAKMETDGITRETMTAAMRDALTQEQVVTRQTLVKMGVTEFMGGLRKSAIAFVAAGASLGGCVVLIQHIWAWVH